MVQLPAGQLELTGESQKNCRDLASTGFLISYTELMCSDLEQVVDEGNLVPRVEIEERPTGEYLTDEDGNLILDEDNQPIPTIEEVPVTFPVRPSMSPNGARNSNRFFRRFEEYNANQDTVNHVGFLSPSELKLIAEWLDIGGQYYNDPFVTPVE